ncbi:MAG: hypothetical protein HZA93_02300 [Verrucomicrobia bacterium]|nr:hypothetical protein [Verrucomicrobiota bacterium]
MSQPNQSSGVIITTGANGAHFANLTMLIASWQVAQPGWPLVICDYGLDADQVSLLRTVRGLQVVAAAGKALTHAWEGKSRLGEYVEAGPRDWHTLVWIDADALLLEPLPELDELLVGYDVLIDAHVQSIGEIMHECNRVSLGVRRDDAYFSSGFWVQRRGCLLESYARGAAVVRGQGNLWENDAFVAAIYSERLKVRTVCGGVWHARGKTSLATCETAGLRAFHAGQPIHVLHANDGYTLRADGRRIFRRPELAAIQDHFERQFWERNAPGQGPSQR